MLCPAVVSPQIDCPVHDTKEDEFEDQHTFWCVMPIGSKKLQLKGLLQQAKVLCDGVRRQQHEDMRLVVEMFAKTRMLQSETRQQSRAEQDSALCKRDSTMPRKKWHLRDEFILCHNSMRKTSLSHLDIGLAVAM